MQVWVGRGRLRRNNGYSIASYPYLAPYAVLLPAVVVVVVIAVAAVLLPRVV